jgi:putative addiction module antidote
MTRTVKIISVGNSAGIILPKELLEKLRVSKGDTLTVTESPTGVNLTAYDEKIARQMQVAEQVMKDNRNMLRKLAQ